MKAMCPKSPSRDGSSLGPEHRPTGKAPGLTRGPWHRSCSSLNQFPVSSVTGLYSLLTRCFKAPCISLLRTKNARLWGPSRSHLFPLYSSEQAFPRFCCKPGSGGQREQTRMTTQDTQLQPVAATSSQKPCQHLQALLQPRSSPEPVTSAAAAQAEPPWCQRSQGRPLLPSRWLPEALLLTPSFLRMPGSFLSAESAQEQ